MRSRAYLRSLDKFDERLVIGPEELSVTPPDRQDCDGLPLAGVFSILHGERVLFYRWDGVLKLRFDSAVPLNLDDLHLRGTEVRWAGLRGTAAAERVHFIVAARSGETIIERRYPLASEIANVASDPTPFLEAEDFDILLFVSNVVNDRARAARIFQPPPTRA